METLLKDDQHAFEDETAGEHGPYSKAEAQYEQSSPTSGVVARTASALDFPTSGVSGLGEAALSVLVGAAALTSGSIDFSTARIGDEVVLLQPEQAPFKIYRAAQPVDVPRWYKPLIAELVDVVSLKEGWYGGCSPPSKEAATNALLFASYLMTNNLEPALVGPMADGGITFRFTRAGRVAEVDVDNDGDLVASLKKSPDHRSDIFEESNLARLVSRVRDFLLG